MLLPQIFIIMKKNLRKQLMDAALATYAEQNPTTDNTTDIVYVLQGTDLYPGYIENYVHNWLDENCANGHYSRWTSHGSWINSQMKVVKEMLEELYYYV